MSPLWKSRRRDEPQDWNGFLERGVRIEGRLESAGTLHLNCQFKGHIASQQGIIFGKESQVEGGIEAREVVIEGSFEGTIVARSRVEILDGATVKADVRSPCLVISPRALFQGTCQLQGLADDGEKPLVIPIRSAHPSAAAAS